MAQITSTQKISEAKAAKTAAKKKLQARVAAAWTLAKTMLPNAPHGEQLKFAKSLLANSTTALKVALKQTAINAHYTRVAEAFANVHKVDMNDLLENPSILSKEESAIMSELKKDPKNASAKQADDRKDAGPLPAKYPEPKRDEPTEMDGEHAADRPAMKEKESAAKTAHDKDCKGCAECDGKKEAAAKDATAKKAHDKDCKGCAECDGKKEAAKKIEGKAAVADVKKDAKAKKAEDEAPADPPAEEPAADAESEEAPADEAPADDAPAEDEPAMDMDAEPEPEPFDEETADLHDAVDDLKDDIENLEETIAEFSDDPSDLSGVDDLLPEGEAGMPEEDMEGMEDMAGDPMAEGDPEGEELDLESIFDGDAMSDKVSSLNDEDMLVAEEAPMEDFFGPGDPADLEAILDQEEELTHPGKMFMTEDTDPMLSLFASAKEASNEIIKPGDLEAFFATDISADAQDAMDDHSDDILAEVADKLKQPTRDDHRDTKPNLQTPKAAKPAANAAKAPASKTPAKAAAPAPKTLAAVAGKTAAKSPAKAPGVVQRLRPTGTPKVAANLAQLLFLDDPDTL